MEYSANNSALIQISLSKGQEESLFIRLILSNLHQSFSYLSPITQQKKKYSPLLL